MRIHRVFTSQPLEPGEAASLGKRQAHYLGRVLRVTPGQVVTLFNGDGSDYACEVEWIGKGEICFTVTARLPAKAESPLQVVVAQAVSRGERMDQTLQKCTELGAFAFQPVWSERVEVRLAGEKLARRRQHWQGVVVSACEQSGRARVPEVLPPLPLAEWCIRPAAGCRIVLSPAADRGLGRIGLSSPVEMAIGPEGGFSDAELGVLERAGVTAARLGPRVLRTETAAAAALAVLQSLAGDF